MGLVIEIQTSNEWHVMKGETQFGPFTYAEMLKMLQDKSVFAFDYAWAPHLENWTMLVDLPDFSQDRIHRIVQKSDAKDVFANRRHDRANCQFEAYVHDNHRMWTATVESISVGGALISIDNPFLLPGDQLTVHFRQGSPAAKGFAQAFNTRMEVLNKRMTKQRLQHDSRLHYVMQFTQLPKPGQELIEKFVSHALKTTQGE